MVNVSTIACRPGDFPRDLADEVELAKRLVAACEARVDQDAAARTWRRAGHLNPLRGESGAALVGEGGGVASGEGRVDGQGIAASARVDEQAERA